MEYSIEMLNVTKEFPGIKANDDITLKVKKGSIHALLGENGAGKSTLMSILFGLYSPTEGKIKINGKEVEINNPNVANDLGIGMVHQHFKLVENFTVTENIILGREPKGRFNTIDIQSSANKIKELSEKYGFKVDPYAKIEDISVGMQQKVEILKMLYRDADILIFDEPTAVLTPQEIDELIDIIKNLSKEGKTVLLITHKLREIKACASEVSILRRGKLIDTVDVATTSVETMSELMVGRKVDLNIVKKPQELGDVVLDVRNLVVESSRKFDAVKDLSLKVRAGEILGIAGIDGNGQSEMISAITGLTKVKSGTVLLSDEDITNSDIKHRFEIGMGHIPEDRHKHGLVLDFKLKENFIVHDYYTESFSHNGILNTASIDTYAERLIEEFDVRSGQGKETLTRSMSGGNQQKAIIARELDRSPKLLIVVQPTRGLDVGAIEYIHRRIEAERENGKAILLVSFELDEIMSLSDRISVIHDGRIMGTMDARDADERTLGLMMAGTEVEGVDNNE